MHKMLKSNLCIAASVLALTVGFGASAQAQESGTSLQALQDQINSLQKQLAQLQTAQEKSAKEATAREERIAKAAKTAKAVKETKTAEVKSDGLKGVIRSKTGIDMTVGGFIDMTMMNRDKNQAADTGSNFNTMIPFNNATNAHQNEIRGSARASRLSLLATGSPDATTKLTGYIESDFGAAGSTSTPGQTNSYVPRIRQAFAGYEDSDLGIHFSAGQMWSLVTMNSAGIDPLKPLVPMVIDAAYIPGVNYARIPQIRFVKDFDDKKGWFGLSVESPQAVTGGICTARSATAGLGNAPSTSTDACTNFSANIKVSSTGFTGNMQGSLTTDVAPDVVAKVAYDPGFGHFELFGVTRFFRDVMISTGHNNYAMGYGVGAGAFVPVIPKAVDIHATVMAGKGIGRYGVTQLPDFSLTPTGGIKPLEQYTAMFGVIGHPTSSLDTYLYAGLEQTFRHNAAGTADNSYGYGNFGASNANCNVPGSLATNCYAQTSSVWQITPGLWYRVYDGNLGKMQIGLQHSWTRRNTFSDNSGINPHGIENMTLLSVRYYPF